MYAGARSKHIDIGREGGAGSREGKQGGSIL